MTIYLDDDSVARELVGLLRKMGHEVILPGDVGLRGAKDQVHLTYAIRKQVVLLTRNRDDFVGLHDLVQAAGGHHFGILVVFYDKKRQKYMKPHQIVAAIGKAEAAHPSLHDLVITLNEWQ
jgi:hypothetical protein